MFRNGGRRCRLRAISPVLVVMTVLALLVGTMQSASAVDRPTAGRGVQGQPVGDGNWSGTAAPKSPSIAWKAPAEKAARVVKADPHAKRVKELTNRRTANASFFQMSDGSVQEELSAVPVHYRDSKGAWQDINSSVTTVSHDGFTLGAVGNTFQAYFSSKPDSLVRLEQGSGFVQLGADGASVSAAQVSGSTVTYKNAYPGADISYQAGPDGLLEKIVLAKAPAAGVSFSFTLKVSGFTPRQSADGAIGFYGEGADPVFVIPAPYMADSKADANSPYGTVYSAKVTQSATFDAATGTMHLTVTPDAKWLGDSHRQYPVTIDPTIVVSPTPSQAANVMILADGPTTNYATSWRLSVGTTTTGAARSLIRFPLPTVPAGTVISSADLKLYYDQTFTDGSKNVAMQALAANAGWNPATATWNNASSIGGPVAGTATMTGNAVDVWNDFPVTSTVQGWLNGKSANNGFVLKAASESTLGQGGPRYEGSIYAYGGEVVNYPKLVITYGVPGVAVNPPTVIHSTGAELSWPAYTNTTGNSANDLAEYQVHRSVFQTFAPSASTEIAPIQNGATSFVDSTAVPTPANNSDPYGNAYYYMVVVKTKGGALIPGPTQLVRLPEAGRTTLLIPAQSATTLSSSQPASVLNTLNNGGTAEPWLEVGDNSSTYGTARAVFNFGALSVVPSGSKVLDAHLKLWQEQTTTGTSGAVYQLHALTRAFTGAQATWNSAASGVNWTSAGGDFTAATGGTVSGLTNDPNRQNLDATSIVQGWVNTPASNDGLLVKLAAESSSSPQERTLFAGTKTAEPGLAPTLVVTYLDTSTGSTYYAPSTPTDMNPGTTYSVPVTINNTTSATWSAASEVLTYHWMLPDGTDVTNSTNQLFTALPSDLAPAGTVTLNAQVTPPTPSDGNQAEGATLAWDMYNKATGVYLSGATSATSATSTAVTGAAKSPAASLQPAASSSGTGSLGQQVSVDPSGNNQLGLENFYPYTTVATGSGGTLYANEASGNTVWNDDLFSNPSRGFNTTLRLSYNSLSTMDTTTGFGWSVQASAPIRLGQALQFHPATKPTSVVMVDGTGNAHQWNLDTTTNTWTSPPGVHLYLQQLVSCGPQTQNSQAWKMTRPDRTTLYFDCEGYPTAQIDANKNEADFNYTSKVSENKPEEFLQYITDPVGRQTLTLTYYNKGDATFSYIDSTGALVSGTNLTDPAIIDHVKSITDVSGRTVDFYYTSEGLLGRVVDGAGDPAAKTFNFTYDATQGMKNVKLVAVQDPRGNTTSLLYYPPSSPFKWQTEAITDRLQHVTNFAYLQPGTITNSFRETTVTDANGNPTSYQTDSSGREIQQVDPLGHTTTLEWDTDNNVKSLTEDNGAQTQWTYDLNTGLPLSEKDALAVKNGTAATTYQYSFADSLDPTLTGHIADLTDVTSPSGRRTHYTYYPDGKGNLETEQAPNGTANGAPPNSYITTFTYDSFGELLSTKDANGHTTTYSYENVIPGTGGIEVPEPTGQPVTITDPMGNTTTVVYGPRGEVLSSTDPLGHTATANYDVFLRPLDSKAPKDQANNVYVITPAPTYDANDNVTSSTAPYISGFPVANSSTVTVYDKDDQPVTVTEPANNSTAPRVIAHGYDNVGNLTSVTEPLGNAATGTYTSTTQYNADNEPISSTDAASHTTKTGYDDVGNQTSVTDPNNHTSLVSYDLDHRQTGTTDAAGNTTAVGYDLDGLVTSKTDENGVKVEFTEDSNGQVTQVKVPHAFNGTGLTYDYTQYTYDQVGNNTSVISPLGVDYAQTNNVTGAYTTSTTYDADNRTASSLGAYIPGDPNYGQNTQPRTDYAYDADSRVASIDQITHPSDTTITPIGLTAQDDHAVTKFSYFDNGWTSNSVDPFQLTTTYDYNGRGEQISRALSSADSAVAGTSDGAQRFMNWSYYPDGSLQNYSDTGTPAGFQDEVITADSGTTEADAGWTAPKLGDGYNGSTYYQGSQNTFTWNLAIPQDGDYQVYAYYSAPGSIANYTISYTDANGNIQTTPGVGQPGNIHVDQTQNVGTWVPIGTPQHFTAGTSGQKVELTAQDTSTPDIADAIRIVRVDSGDTQPAGPNNFDYSYDPNGNLSDVADTSPNAQFNDYTPQFNNIDQLTQVLEKSGTDTKHTLTYSYDPAGNLATQTFDATSNTYTYDKLNELQQVINKQSDVSPAITTGYTYTPTGQVATETKGNKNVVTNSYNDDGTVATSNEITSTGTLVESHNYGYDDNNNVLSDQYTLQNAGGAANYDRTALMTYDPNNQVTSINSTGNPGSADNQLYKYDSSGNLIDQTTNGVQVGYTYTHDRLTQSSSGIEAIGTYQYDTLGRLADVVNGNTWGVTGSVNQRYNYDGFDNVILQTQQSSTGTNTTTAAYDSLNRPTSETVSGLGLSQTDTLDYLGSSKTVADESINFGTGTETKDYSYSPNGERLAMLDTQEAADQGPSQATDYYTYNDHQDVEALTDGTSGSTISTYGYTAYGADDTNMDSGLDANIAGLPVFPLNSYRFNSGRVDSSTGNLDMGFRTYDPNINSFISRDSYNGSGADMSMAGGSRYAFGGGNPISNVEENGHSFWSTAGAIAIGIGIGIGCAALAPETAGIGTVLVCGAIAGAASGVAATGISCAQGEGSCSPTAFAESAAIGGVAGLVTAGVADGLGGLLPDTLSATAAGTVKGIAGGAAGGAAGYGTGCAIASDCSWGGLAEATAFGGALGGALGFAGAGGAGCGQSFTAGTQVQLADGSTTSISSLTPGDKVKSTDTKTGKTKDSTASAVLVNHDTDLYNLTVHTAKGDQVIHTTAHHQFFDKTTHSWVQAAKLHRGDQLTTDDGSTVTVEGGATPAVSSGDMWDLTVPGDHDFYVMAGDTAVLVHNCTTEEGTPTPAKGSRASLNEAGQKSYDTLKAAVARVRANPNAIREQLGENQIGRTDVEFYIRRMWAGSALEKAVAADPEVVADANIAHLGASSPGQAVPDFVIGGEYNVDVTGDSATSIRVHEGRDYYDHADQILRYPTLTPAEVAQITG